MSIDCMIRFKANLGEINNSEFFPFSLLIMLIGADRGVCLLHIRTDFISCNSIVFKLSPLH